jgi:hypothetical protein
MSEPRRESAPLMPSILALDLAHRTGFAEGRMGEVPSTGSIVLGGPHSVIERRCIELRKWLDAQIVAFTPDVIAIEASVVAQMRGKFMATEPVMKSVYGLLMAARETAVEHGYEPIQVKPGQRYHQKCLIEINPQEVRKHFLGKRTFSTPDDGKRAVKLQAELIGWTVNDLDAADAVALWDAASATVAPNVYSRSRAAKFTGRLPATFRPSIGKSGKPRPDGPLSKFWAAP